MQLAHECTGEGPALVLIHGITECLETWRPLIAPLSDRYRVIAVDLRGHGRSGGGDTYDPVTLATDVIDTLDLLDVHTPLVIGHSLGGVVATACAAISRPRAVLNVDQPLRLASFKDALTQLEPMLRGDQASFQTAIDLVFQQMMGPLDESEARRVSALRRADQAVVLSIWGTIFASSTDELDLAVGLLTAAVTVPYLSLHGIDPGPEYTTWLRHHIPSSTVEVWPEQGHYPHLTQPARFLERLFDFDPIH
ncbi:MAG: hypothetical protein RLZZ623_31 [Actinomycetota bacterium]|jgi:pimeloyl-ACP methyl ester carboxylesterase